MQCYQSRVGTGEKESELSFRTQQEAYEETC